MDIQRFENFFRVWPLILKRLIVNWRTLSTVVVGVVLACSIMSGTVIFFDSLKEIALDESLRSLIDEDTNILIQAEKGPTNYLEASNLDKRVHSFSDDLFGAHIRDVLLSLYSKFIIKSSKLPGCSEYVRIPKSSTRLANSAACITLASFDCWYAVILLYDPGVFWK